MSHPASDFAGFSSAGEARARWRKYAPENMGKPALRVGLAGTFTLDTFVPLLGATLLEMGFSPALFLAPFNQLFQVCIDPHAFFGECDVIVLAWRLEDVMGEEFERAVRDEPEAIAACEEKITALMHAVATLRANFSKSLLVGIPPLPSTGVAAPLDLGGAASRLHRQLAGAMSEGLSQIPGVRGWDLDLVERNVGSASAVDFRQWYLYRQPFSEVFLLAAATLLGRLIAAPRRAPRKCVVVDGDNTLWGGIVGEDGAAGVQIGEEFPGSAYRDFQRLLLHWRAQGVLLALASKNNEADVWELFQSRPDMPITRDDFAAHRINWETKPENLASLARELNLGLESFVFIDDSPIEIDFVRRALPQVLCILLPDEPAEILPRLRSLTCFDRFEVTTEDRSRAEMMLAERQRQAATGTLSKEEFQRSLDLRVRLFPAAEEDLERIAQLINKTNQFNLSARRRTVDEVRALFCATTHRIYGVQVADRFGSYGLTGVVILEAAAAAHGPGWSVDTFLLSCRVLGRGVEGAILAALAEEATAGGVVEIAAIYLPNGKNAQAAAFLPESGFALDDGGVWRLDPAAVPSLAPFITVTRAREA